MKATTPEINANAIPAWACARALLLLDEEKHLAVLCYVCGQWAYFTTRKLSEQWGDDWNDAPYEHNAGTPYEYYEHDKKEGREPWAILKVDFDGDFEAPCEGHNNSPWSVEQINAGAIAWLRTSKWNKTQVIIPAGTTLARFCELIAQGGGQTYLPNPIKLPTAK